MMQKIRIGITFCIVYSFFQIRLDQFLKGLRRHKKIPLHRKVISARSIVDIAAQCSIVKIDHLFLVFQYFIEQLSDKAFIKEKARLAKCLLEQLDTFKKLKILSKSETILPDSDWRNLIEIVNTLYDDFISRLRVAYPDLTEDAIRFCCLIKLRLTSAELMSVLNVTKDAIYKRKFRLKKELMPDDDPRSLDDFLGSY